GTIICIKGDENVVKLPVFGSRSGDDSGKAQNTNPTIVTNIKSDATQNALDSLFEISSITGRSSASESTLIWLKRGSIILSVIYQPTPTIRIDDKLVNNQLFNGFKSIFGSMICAADCVKLWSNGSILEGIKFALNPPDTPANAAAIPANGCRPAA